MIDKASVPNHHADFPAFSGVFGVVAAVGFLFGRDSDARLAIRLSALTRDDTVVDVGCGPGVAVRHAAAEGASVTGVDPAAAMLRVARLVIRAPNARFVEGAAEALPLDDDSATVLWSIATAHHWADLDAGLREAARVLRPGGRLVAIERLTSPAARGHASHGWTNERAEAFADRCRDHGFADVRVEDNQAGKRRTLSVVGAYGGR